MPKVPAVIFGPSFLERNIDATARGLLREDTPDYWTPDQHALSNLLDGAGSVVLQPARFDELSDDNKFIVVALARHVLDWLSQHYVRKVAKDEVPDHIHLGVNIPVMYFATERLAGEILRLARTPGSDGASVLNPPAEELASALHDASIAGQLVSAGRLETLVEHAQPYHEALERTRTRKPETNVDDLDSDDMHAFLCAYQECTTTERTA